MNTYCVYALNYNPLKWYMEDGTQPCDAVYSQIQKYNDWLAEEKERKYIAAKIAAMKAELQAQND